MVLIVFGEHRPHEPLEGRILDGVLSEMDPVPQILEELLQFLEVDVPVLV